MYRDVTGTTPPSRQHPHVSTLTSAPSRQHHHSNTLATPENEAQDQSVEQPARMNHIDHRQILDRHPNQLHIYVRQDCERGHCSKGGVQVV